MCLRFCLSVSASLFPPLSLCLYSFASSLRLSTVRQLSPSYTLSPLSHHSLTLCHLTLSPLLRTYCVFVFLYLCLSPFSLRPSSLSISLSISLSLSFSPFLALSSPAFSSPILLLSPAPVVSLSVSLSVLYPQPLIIRPADWCNIH